MADRPGRSQEFGLSFILALQAATIFVLAPLTATGVLSSNVIEVCRMGLAAVAVMLVTRNWLVSTAIVLTLLASFVLSISFRSTEQVVIVSLGRIVALTAFDLAIAWAVAKVAFGDGRVNIHRIMGALILYLSIGLVFANAYRACALLLHPSFSGLNQGGGHFISETLYFSLATLTSTNYGDIIPLHPVVRSLCNLESAIGQLFPATLLARLVTLHTSDTTDNRTDQK
jgi:hypothetical protein